MDTQTRYDNAIHELKTYACNNENPGFGEINQMTKVIENGVRLDEDSTCTANEMLHKAHTVMHWAGSCAN